MEEAIPQKIFSFLNIVRKGCGLVTYEENLMGLLNQIIVARDEEPKRQGNDIPGYMVQQGTRKGSGC